MPTFKKIIAVNEQYAVDNFKEPTAIKRLLMHHGGLSATDFYVKKDEEMSVDAYHAFLKDVDAYITKDTPVQHLIGSEVFYGYTFKVNKDVLIPRYETEELVTNTLDYIDTFFSDSMRRVADIGTGSGCIGLTLKKELPNLTVTVTDISKKALRIAKENAESLAVDVTLLDGNMCEPLANQEKFDIIVSNLPYLKNDEHVENIVKAHEPHEALFGGPDGLGYYRALFDQAETILKVPYMIALEHGFEHAKAIKKIIHKRLSGVTVVQKKDMQGKDRMTFVFKK